MAKCVCPPPKKGAAKAKPKAKPKPSKTAKPKPSKTAKPKTGGGKKDAPKKDPLKTVSKKAIEKKSGGKRHGHPPNMFILYFLDMYRQYGGNMYCVARECGRRWREGVVSAADKAKYKKLYCTMCKNCKSCQASKKK